MTPIRPSALVRTALCIAFLASAVFHVLALKFPRISIPEPWWEHRLFVVWNIGAAVLVLREPLTLRARRWEFAAVLLFVVAQLAEHTARLIVRHDSPQDWLQNLGAIVFALLLVIAKCVELRCVQR